LAAHTLACLAEGKYTRVSRKSNDVEWKQWPATRVVRVRQTLAQRLAAIDTATRQAAAAFAAVCDLKLK